MMPGVSMITINVSFHFGPGNCFHSSRVAIGMVKLVDNVCSMVLAANVNYPVLGCGVIFRFWRALGVASTYPSAKFRFACADADECVKHVNFVFSELVKLNQRVACKC